MNILDGFNYVINNLNISLFQLKYLAYSKPTDILPYKCEKFLIPTMIATLVLSAGFNVDQDISNTQRLKNIVKDVFLYGVISTTTLAVGHIYFKIIISPVVVACLEYSTKTIKKYMELRI